MKVETYRAGFGVDAMKISGFTCEELRVLKVLDNESRKQAVGEIFEKHNDGTWAEWEKGNRIFHTWVMDGAVFAEVGQVKRWET